MKMTQEEFDRERRYQTATHFLKKMLLEGLISDEEYCRIDTINHQKYRPVFGSLLSKKDLIYKEIRANIRPGKETESHEKRENTGNRGPNS